ncbi:MAG: hypothetical protein GX657_03815 [Chloroflexi bacterium]|jgi:hypothetical protein|nr:hypothetical protein [Chloroflexota bacterium]
MTNTPCGPGIHKEPGSRHDAVISPGGLAAAAERPRAPACQKVPLPFPVPSARPWRARDGVLSPGGSPTAVLHRLTIGG